MKRKLFTLLLAVIGIKSFASHNIGGEITYKYISGYSYEITVTTYTKESSTLADKCALTVRFGDGDSAVFNRLNGPKNPSLCNGTIPIGETLADNVKKNI